MHSAPGRILSSLLICALICAPSATRAAAIPNDPATIEHALNRLAFGPRPGDVEHVRRLGLSKWIDQQLDPSRRDDAELQKRLPAMPMPPPDLSSPREARQFGRQSVEALSSAKLTRAVYSDHQLDEVLVDFWFNHFNVFAGKGRTALYLAEYEREAIRPYVFGRFRDMLAATAKSPAMLFYLDNWLSADPEAAERIAERRADRGLQPPQNQRRRGLNENYARELMELHTLGVDGGYTQDDIIAVARAFTGWTIWRSNENLPRRDRREARARGTAVRGNRVAMDLAEGGTFRFVRALHDANEKVVLGRKLPSGRGLEDGEQVLDILASHRSTARHIATKLAQRFVSDHPPETLIARAAARFTQTDGNLREVVRTIVTSPEFFDASAQNAKVKTPFEFVVSAVRATGRDVSGTMGLVGALRQLGMPLYLCQPPTGYDEAGETWTSAGALVARMNVAQQIAGADAATIGGAEFQRR